MARELNTNGNRSPASLAMDEAIDLAIEGRSPYPDGATFVDADMAGVGEAIRRATDDGGVVVLVSPDGSTRILRAESVLR